LARWYWRSGHPVPPVHRTSPALGKPIADRLDQTIRITVVPLRRERVSADLESMLQAVEVIAHYATPHTALRRESGLAEGIGAHQEIVLDRVYDPSAWRHDLAAICDVTIADAATWHEFTDGWPPQRPLGEADYSLHQMPWSHHYADLGTAPELTRELQMQPPLPTDYGFPFNDPQPTMPLRPPGG